MGVIVPVKVPEALRVAVDVIVALVDLVRVRDSEDVGRAARDALPVAVTVSDAVTGAVAAHVRDPDHEPVAVPLVVGARVEVRECDGAEGVPVQLEDSVGLALMVPRGVPLSDIDRETVAVGVNTAV